MLGVFPFGFVIEDQLWALAGTMLAAYALIAVATFLGTLALLLLERRRERC